MKRGQKLYRSYRGAVEVVKFIKEDIIEGATLPTWLVRSEGRQVRCSPGHYYESLEQAMGRDLHDQQLQLKYMMNAKHDLEEKIRDQRSLVDDMTLNLRDLRK
jgi:hypothetical protein